MNSTIRIYVRAVRVFFNFCFQEGFIKMNLSAGVKLPANDAKLEMPLFAHEVEQVDSMFLSDSIFGARNLAIVHCMLDCGLRSQEVIKLCIHHVHFDKNVIEIVQSKYDKSRVVFLPPDLASNLQKYLSFRPTVSSDRLFLKNDETPIDYNVIKQLFSRIRSHTGIYRLHPHLLRHTFGVSYLIGGGNLEFLRDMMGHSDYNVTRTYVSMANQYRMMGLDVYRLPDKLFQITV